LPIRAFLLILFAATAHATWNFLAKRFAENKQLIWFASVTETLILIPFVVGVIAAHGFAASSIAFLFSARDWRVASFLHGVSGSGISSWRFHRCVSTGTGLSPVAFLRWRNRVFA
jgi:hypothetical protein